MDDLNEETFVNALAQIKNWNRIVPSPSHLIVTPQGLAYQAKRFKEGELTEADMRAANLPDWLIEQVKLAAKDLS